MLDHLAVPFLVERRSVDPERSGVSSLRTNANVSSRSVSEEALESLSRGAEFYVNVYRKTQLPLTLRELRALYRKGRRGPPHC